MSRPTVSNFLAVVAGAALAASVVPGHASNDASLASTIQETVQGVLQKSSPAIVRVEADDDLGKVAGTGFFADAAGTIYTLSSVVGDGLSIQVTQGDRKLPARLLANDHRSGIAVIKVEEAGVTPFLPTGDCQELQTAAPLVVLGYPYDHALSPGFGVIAGFDRKSQGKFFTTTHIRANIPVQRGQGGSPVLDLEGRVVGVLVSGFEQGGGCYVLPIRAAEKVRTDLARFGEVRHGWAGVTVQEIPLSVQGSRMMIDVVDPSGPAAGKFLHGDVILQVGDIVVREPEDALDASYFLTAGDNVEVRVARGEEILTIPFTPGEHPSDRKGDLQALGPGSLTAPTP